ncbi:MAG: nucleoside hydrolase [Chitinophagaceae bacterium]|nr:nucleoside hydrolase [Chitinophagaceae bacterium]
MKLADAATSRKGASVSLICSMVLLLLSGCAQQQSKDIPIPVIFDTDIGNDIDDVLALQMLLNYEKEGTVNILGITISKSNPRVIEYADGYCLFNGRKNMPLGYAYNGVNPEPYRYVPATLDTLVNGEKVLFPQRSLANDIPEGYVLQRQLLAAQPDHSVVMIVVGPQTNMQRLLESGPDEYSDLNGVELVSKKVRLLSVMGGLYTKGSNLLDWNIVQDLKAAKTLFEKWPGEIVVSGPEVGNDLPYPHQSIVNDFTEGHKHPLCISYKLYAPMPYDRPTWDLTSVLYAIEPDAGYFDLSGFGTIAVDSVGNGIFTDHPNGKHRYVKVPGNKKKMILRKMVSQVTGKREPMYQ